MPRFVLAVGAIAAGSLLTAAPSGGIAQAAVPPAACGTAIDSFADGVTNVADAILSNPQLSYFGAGMTNSGLYQTLVADGATVLVPTDAAFAELPEAVLQSIMGDSTLMYDLFGVFVIPGAPSADDLMAAGVATSLLDTELIFAADGDQVVINGEAVVCGHAEYPNGTIVVIDSFLSGPSLELSVPGSSVPGSSVPDSSTASPTTATASTEALTPMPTAPGDTAIGILRADPGPTGEPCLSMEFSDGSAAIGLRVGYSVLENADGGVDGLGISADLVFIGDTASIVLDERIDGDAAQADAFASGIGMAPCGLPVLILLSEIDLA